jgi:hypothetical protein
VTNRDVFQLADLGLSLIRTWFHFDKACLSHGFRLMVNTSARGMYFGCREESFNIDTPLDT